MGRRDDVCVQECDPDACNSAAVSVTLMEEISTCCLCAAGVHAGFTGLLIIPV